MLNLLSFADVELTFGEAALYSVIGFVLIIVVLAVMALLIALLNYLTKKGVKKQPAGKPQEDSTPAPGSCGSVKLFDVPDKEAAMIMAIVADKLETPLNELKFVSIKEKRRTRTEMKYNVKLNGKIYEVEVEKGVASLLKEYDAISAPAPVLPAQPAAPAPADAVTATVTKGANAVESPLPGVVMELKVSVGAKVKRGDVVLTIEAMKMENEISASKDGTVTAFYVQKGSKVEQGTPIYELA
ncbi:MAG: OadG family transporter subunit [Christensenellales bacterium]